MSGEELLPIYTALERSRELGHRSQVLYKRAQRSFEQHRMLQEQTRRLLDHLCALVSALGFLSPLSSLERSYP